MKTRFELTNKNKRIAQTMAMASIFLGFLGASLSGIVFFGCGDGDDNENPIARAEAPASKPIIAFSSNRDGNLEIYVMDTDGQNQRNLTSYPGDDRAPEWSPDGNKIAFQSDRDGNDEIYVMDANGKNQRNLTNNPAGDTDGSWFDPAFVRK